MKEIQMDQIDRILRSPTLVGLLILAVVVYFSNYLLKPRYDPKEPPVLPQKLPYIGHLYSLLTVGFGYYTKLSKKHKLPIYTLQMLKSKVYVVNSLDLAVVVQRNSKNLPAGPLQAAALPRIFGLGDEATSIMTKSMQDEKGQWLVKHPIIIAYHTHLLPGPNVDSISRKMQNTLNPLLNQLQAQTKSDEDTVFGLYAWTRKNMGLAVTEAIYGRENPFKLQPELIEAFWEMHNGFTLLLVGIMPWLIARPAAQARQQLIDGMNRYYAGNWRDDASGFIQARYDSIKETNLSNDDIARVEIGNMIGVMSNLIPSSFWLLNYIYADPILLEKLREEIDASSWTTTTSNAQTGDGSSKKTIHLNIKKIQEECKLLIATYQEVFRMQTVQASSRFVVKDTLLNDQYLLKKGSMVQLPGAVIHQDQEVWGPTAHLFNPLRFMPDNDNNNNNNNNQKRHPAATRWFGGGATLCPGRHLAVVEIISFVAMFIIRFDLTPVNFGWRIPEPEEGGLVSGIPPPSCDIDVRVETRVGFEEVDWVFDHGV